MVAGIHSQKGLQKAYKIQEGLGISNGKGQRQVREETAGACRFTNSNVEPSFCVPENHPAIGILPPGQRQRDPI